MRNLIYIVLFIPLGCNYNQTLNKEQLAKELDSIMLVDQEYRAQMQAVNQKFGWDSPEMTELLEKMHRADSSNLSRVLEIIESVGEYPGVSLVGHSASKASFFVLQHAPDSVQEQYFKLIMEAARENELDKGLAAMYQDRYLMHRGEPQIFGTQIRIEYDMDSSTGERVERA